MPPLADILHRTLVVGLLGVTVAGVGTGWAVHKDTLKRGQGSWAVIDLCHSLCVLSGFGNKPYFGLFVSCIHPWVSCRDYVD